MTFSVIIINYRTYLLTKSCLTSLLSLKSKDRFEIVLVDNASNDGSIEALDEIFGDKIKIIKCKENLGFSGGNNLGSKKAQGEYLLFLNSDTEVSEDIFNSAKNIFKSDKKIGIISPLLLDKYGNEQKNSFGSFPNLKNLIINKSFINKNNKIQWLSGCALFISKKIFYELKGFDEKFFLYFEDVDICKRASDIGYRCHLDKNTNITHLSGQSLNKNRKRKLIYYKSQNYYFKKHYGLALQIIMRIMRLPIKLWKTK